MFSHNMRSSLRLCANSHVQTTRFKKVSIKLQTVFIFSKELRSRNIGIIKTEVSVISGRQGKADNADRGLNNSDILRKPNSIILLLFNTHEKSAIRIQIKNN